MFPMEDTLYKAYGYFVSDINSCYYFTDYCTDEQEISLQS